MDETGTREADAHDEKRKRWEIHVTAAERAFITEAAHRAKLTIGAYVIALASKSQILVRSDWETGVDRLTEVSRLLGDLSRNLDAMPDALDRLEMTAQLLSIERQIERLAAPWLGGADDGC
ncbi:plasmid mobilization protein [Pseudoroseicyclus tamaricis]|uniref:Uncharacterized protein n=1 Tax=Pseudoroseicyclus tamaricis TaxID=2705421 RepID=A0A6B2JQY9_9RHOB|nr:hypothetical protein [Pseudoroseicyclus tamaricis]NDV00588.1 hypothetical protein [Pseudoroseicyclus tamaricis]